jgi:hypothetical protein
MRTIHERPPNKSIEATGNSPVWFAAAGCPCASFLSLQVEK